MRVANNDRMNSSLISLGKIAASLEELIKIVRQVLAISIVARTLTTSINQHGFMFEFQENSFLPGPR